MRINMSVTVRIWLLCALVAGATAWNYIVGDPAGPANWPGVCVGAGSTSQSPININTTSAVSSTYSAFSFTGYNSVNVQLQNNEKTVKGQVAPSPSKLLSGGGLSGSYKLDHFQLHWGSTNTEGSEHLLDGVQSVMEVQFVHYDNTYANLNAALGATNGVAILSWLFDNDTSNVAWDTIFAGLPLAPGSTYSITSLNLNNIMGTVGDFYRYDGSLTSPNCDQGVIWTVFKDKIKISNSQIGVMRSVVDSSSNPIHPNYRPVQLLNTRTVYKDP